MNDSADDKLAEDEVNVNFAGFPTQENYLDDNDDDDDGLMETERTKLLTTEGETGNRRLRNDGTLFTYEESLTAVGTGRFHVLLLLLCGWAVSSDAVEVLSVSFLLPSATCDLHLSSQDKGWLNAIVFVDKLRVLSVSVMADTGMMVGGYFWGSLADRSGRRSVLMWSLTVNGLGGLLSSTAQVFWLFLLFRFISGIGVGGSIPVIFTYFTEFQSKVRRGSMISVLATFWMAGNILAAGLAWLVIPHLSLGYFSADFTYNSWRIFIALCTIPSLSSAAIFVLMPESPKFLLQKRKEVEAISVLKRVHRSNKSTLPFDVSTLIIAEDQPSRKIGSVIESSMDSLIPVSSESACCSLFKNTLKLFEPRLRNVTCVLLVVSFSIAFGYYGLFMWFPEIFNRIDKNGGTLCEPGHRGANTSSNITEPCRAEVGDVVYLEGFLTALSNLPGNLLTIALMDRIGRKVLLASSMVISGLSVFLLWFVHERWQNVLMSCIFGAVSTVGFNSLDVLQSELFPTDVRCTSAGFQALIARTAAILGNLIFGSMVDVHCSVPMILVAALMSFGGLMSCLLPDTVGVDIH